MAPAPKDSPSFSTVSRPCNSIPSRMRFSPTLLHAQMVRGMAEQIASGLRALHRLELVHQYLKPDNILIDKHGTIKLIDFGSIRIAGLEEMNNSGERVIPQGTLNYAAPECLRGERCNFSSDLFSLGTILYEILTGKLPYGENDTPQLRKHLDYTPVRRYNQEIPTWVDAALEKAVHPNPARRYDTLSEFLHDLKHPNLNSRDPSELPLLEHNPLRFWKSVSVILLLFNLLFTYLILRNKTALVLSKFNSSTFLYQVFFTTSRHT